MTETSMHPPTTGPAELPAFIRWTNPLSRRLLRLGFPMGPNILLTVRGRTSGEPRSAAVAVVELEGHRWVIGAYGDVNWVRNLRASGEGAIRLHGHDVRVTARELDRGEATAFFDRTLPTYVASLPWLGRRFARLLFGLIGPEIMTDPERAAATRPVFEIRQT